jgi:hypothetical protein
MPSTRALKNRIRSVDSTKQRGCVGRAGCNDNRLIHHAFLFQSVVVSVSLSLVTVKLVRRQLLLIL